MVKSYLKIMNMKNIRNSYIFFGIVLPKNHGEVFLFWSQYVFRTTTALIDSWAHGPLLGRHIEF